MEMDKAQRQHLRDACADGEKCFTAEIVLGLLDALDSADRAAIVALREPTEAMIEAAGWCEVWLESMSDTPLLDLWRAMIDAALESKT